MSLSDSDIRLITDSVIKRKKKVGDVALRYGIASSRVYQLVSVYKKTGTYYHNQKRGRKPKVISSSLQQKILETKKKCKVGSSGIAHYLRKKEGIHIGNMTVHNILLKEGLTAPDPCKSNRRKPWIRYEREHSLSAVHMDWSVRKDGVTYVCVVLDDASRMVLAGGEFSAPTAANSIMLLREAYEKYQHISPIREVITDHGTQFCAVKRNKYGEADHSFEMFCKEYGIVQIFARVKHPQTNGKLERWFQTYEKYRDEFETFQEFVDWYNKIRPHMSLDWNIMETPEMAFYRKAVDLIRSNCVAMFAREFEKT